MNPPFVLLIGFGYWGSSQVVPGTIVDLYRMALIARSVLKAKDVVVMTDITSEEAAENLRQLILDGEIGTDVLDFIGQSRCIPWTTSIESVLFGRREIFIYFSGHGRNGLVTLPNGQDYDLVGLVDRVAAVGADVVALIDCCHASSVRLPFVLDDGRWTRSDPGPRRVGTGLVLAGKMHVGTTSLRGSDATRSVVAGLVAHHDLADLAEHVVISATFPTEMPDWMRPLCRIRRTVHGFSVRMGSGPG